VTGREWTKGAGFSLLECVLALELFALCLLAIMQVAAHVVRTNQLARDYDAALCLAQEKMEKIKGLAYGNVSGGYEPLASAGSATGPKVFQRRVTVLEQTIPPLKRVWVEVSWQAGRRRQVVLASEVSP